MIYRMFIPIVLMMVLSDTYIDLHYLRHSHRYGPRLRLLWWLPTAVMLVYTFLLSSIRNFVPGDLDWIVVYFFLVGIFIVPKAAFCICSLVGWMLKRVFHFYPNYGNWVGIAAGTVLSAMFIYSMTFGIRELKVRYVTLYFYDLPQSFDGYRIVHFTDLHVGSFDDDKAWMLRRAVDSINAQKADLICFTGDLENIQPLEVRHHASDLRRLKAKDGVVSILGNHDYSMYVGVSDTLKKDMERELKQWQRNFGWHLLLNDHITLYRAADSLVIAGEENDGDGRFPQLGNIKKTLDGEGRNSFIVMLQHDPKAWERDILPHSHAQLTLSGHTHGGQVQILGLRPTMLAYREDYGIYARQAKGDIVRTPLDNADGYKGSPRDRYLIVSGGLGGVLPMRFGVPPEIVVITLRRAQRQ